MGVVGNRWFQPRLPPRSEVVASPVFVGVCEDGCWAVGGRVFGTARQRGREGRGRERATVGRSEQEHRQRLDDEGGGGRRLRALPRAPGATRRNALCYWFDADGEARLTGWMREHLIYSYREMPDNIAAAEKDAIGINCPPLNLVGWANSQRSEIKRLRALCVAEAIARRA